MTKEETLNCIKVMQAYCDGAEIEIHSKYNPDDIWEVQEPYWNWSKFNYRIKPTLKLRPWKVEEVPLDAWYMKKADRCNLMRSDSIHLDTHRVKICGTWWNLTELCDSFMHSLDGGKTWLPCGVEE